MTSTTPTTNPYRTPGAPVADVPSNRYAEIRILSPRGRIGRARYIAYSLGYSMLISLALAALVALVRPAPGSALAIGLTGISYVIMFALLFLLSIQRAHDFNTTGWLSILAVIPVVNLLFWFIPGTDGENRFGPPPPPNSRLVVFVGAIIPIVMIAGIVLAIALPAYQQYSKRAAGAQIR